MRFETKALTKTADENPFHVPYFFWRYGAKSVFFAAFDESGPKE